MLYLRSVFFYMGYISSGILASLIACLIGPFLSLHNRLKFFSLWPRFVNWFLYFTCEVKVIVEGKENLPLKPCVIVSNHQGQWETFYMQYLFHPLCTLLKRELLFIPLWGWAMSLINPIAINRGKPREALKQALEEGHKRLERGLFVLFYPEGTRIEAGKIGKYSRSSFELALRSNVPVLPIVHNSGDCWPAHKFLKQSGTIKLIIGKCFFVTSAKDSSVKIEAWSKKILEEIRS